MENQRTSDDLGYVSFDDDTLKFNQQQQQPAKNLTSNLQKKQQNLSKLIEEIFPTNFSDNYHFESIITENSNGYVFKAYDKNLKLKVVIKKSNHLFALSNEIKLAKKAYEICPKYTLPVLYYNLNLGIMIQPLYGLSLYSYMVKINTVLNIADVKVIYKKIIKLLIALQKHKIYHLDLKEENILIDPISKKVKLIDFGVSRQTPVQKNNIVGSKEFCSPEIFYSASNTSSLPKHDIWSLGVCLYSSITGQLPYKKVENLFDCKEQIDLNEIKKSLIENGMSDGKSINYCLDMFRSIFVLDYRKRISLEELVNCKFFN